MIVVDTNIIAARTLTSDLTSQARQLEKKDPVWIVPPLWRYEFQNILATAIKAQQITPEDALRVWESVSELMVVNESEPSPAEVIDLVAQNRITAYDGQFVALAVELGVFLITQDRELRSKFPGVAISMEDFLHGPVIEEATRRKKGHRR